MHARCDPQAAEAVIDRIFESESRLPGFGEVIKECLSASIYTEEAFVYGQGASHVSSAPFKIKLAKKNPLNPNEPPRYAMCRCGCPECHPERWCAVAGCQNRRMRNEELCGNHANGAPAPKLVSRIPGHWEKRGIELSETPGGRQGFMQLLKELRGAGHPLGKQISGGMKGQG